MKKSILLFSLFLAGCQTTDSTILTANKLIVVKPTESMYNCPTIKSFPNPEKLTDIQVAKTIVTLYKNNIICKNSINAIQEFLNKSETEVNSKDTQ